MALHPEATLGNTIGAAYLGVIGAAMYVLLLSRAGEGPHTSLDCLG